MEAASVMIRELQDLRSPHRDATPPTDATTITKHLVAAAVAQTRLRHDACASVLDNLRYCKQNGLTYDPLRSYTKGDATPGPDSRKKHLVQVRFESWSTFWIQDRRPSSLLWSLASSALMVSCSVSWTTNSRSSKVVSCWRCLTRLLQAPSLKHPHASMMPNLFPVIKICRLPDRLPAHCSATLSILALLPSGLPQLLTMMTVTMLRTCRLELRAVLLLLMTALDVCGPRRLKI